MPIGRAELTSVRYRIEIVQPPIKFNVAGSVVELAVGRCRGLAVHRDRSMAEEADGVPAAIGEVEDGKQGLRAHASVRAEDKG